MQTKFESTIQNLKAKWKMQFENTTVHQNHKVIREYFSTKDIDNNDLTKQQINQLVSSGMVE